MEFTSWFSECNSTIPARSVEAVLELAEGGATVPFIARYRKEQTGNLNEVAIQEILDGHERFDQILKRQEFILGEIERQGKLTEELKTKISASFDLRILEDLYLPYKQKRKTKAAAAREAGLEPFADWIWNCGHGLEEPLAGQDLQTFALAFYNADKGISDAPTAIGGAEDILVERISEIQELRQLVRSAVFDNGTIRTSQGKKAKPHSKYENYFKFQESIASLLKPESSHRYLALRRGWNEDELVLSIGGKLDPNGSDGGFEEKLLSAYEAAACSLRESPGAEVLLRAARNALKAHVLPSIEAEAHKALKEAADQVAIRVFADNVRKLLLAAPFGAKAVLGVDPGLRTGCKIAVVNDSGRYIASTVLHLEGESREVAKKLVQDIVPTGNIQAVAVGNGTAGREAEAFVRESLREAKIDVPVVMVSESGASVYSASEIAREEFPDLDVTIRGAISIARRLQDPLAELVKIEPKSIGVGQYQHDLSEPALKRSLDQVVDSCVNSVGVNLNTASYPLLSHVAGIGPVLAKNIVELRATRGLFKSRSELLEVPRFSQKAFEQAAGFIRVPESANPLDNTGVHPERYALIEAFAKKIGKALTELTGGGARLLRESTELKSEAGEYTFEDIVRELERPGRDPRDEFVPFHYREDVRELKDLKPGMTCPGIVSNVTNFGAFVDIGVHQDGLVHLSQLTERFVKDPREVVSPGDQVQVRVLEVNLEKSQISLTMRMEKPKTAPQTRNAHPRSRPPHPQPHSHSRPQPGHRSPKRDVRAKPDLRPPKAPKPKPIFNNAFAGLAALKSQLKK